MTANQMSIYSSCEHNYAPQWHRFEACKVFLFRRNSPIYPRCLHIVGRMTLFHVQWDLYLGI